MNWLMIGGATLLATQAAASGGDKPTVLNALSRCRTVVADAERLRCFDQASAALDGAIADKHVVAMDPAAAQAERRRQFGLPAKHRDEASLGDADPMTVQQIEGTLAAATVDAGGDWTFILDGGAVWRQTGFVEFTRSPQPGDKITIRRDALGHKLFIGKRSVRVTRLR